MVHTKCPEFRRHNEKPSASFYSSVTMVIFIYSQINISLIFSWFIFSACLYVWRFPSSSKKALGLHINVNLTFFRMFLVIEGSWAGGSSSCQIQVSEPAIPSGFMQTLCCKRPLEKVFCESGLRTSPKLLIKAG